MTLGGAHVLYFHTTLNSPEGANLRLRFLDRKSRLLAEQAQAAGANDPKPGIYTKSHAWTAFVEVVIEKVSSSKPTTISSVSLTQEDYGHRTYPSKVDLGRALVAPWEGRESYLEPVLISGPDSSQLSGQLLFTPTRVVSVQDDSLKTTYREGVDYTVKGREILMLPHSRMPHVPDSSLEKGEYKWNVLTGKHVVVTYQHQADWKPDSQPEPSALPRIQRRLASKQPVLVAAIGDSITLGIGTSGYGQLPPYMPTWPQLVVDGLKKHYRNPRVQLANAAMGGMTSDWGRETTPTMVATLKPDLVIIAFGMNDFWWMPPELLRENTEKMMASVRSESPECEFILIAPIPFDPIYASEEQYRLRLASYAPALQNLKGAGVAVVDMHSVGEQLYKRKKPKDLLSDPLHPNDFLARIYAQQVLRHLGYGRSE
ncbi:MAG: SGNH/GDSL hydrolase family protein [Fimbriimonas sp.]